MNGLKRALPVRSTAGSSVRADTPYEIVVSRLPFQPSPNWKSIACAAGAARASAIALASSGRRSGRPRVDTAVERENLWLFIASPLRPGLRPDDGRVLDLDRRAVRDDHARHLALHLRGDRRRAARHEQRAVRALDELDERADAGRALRRRRDARQPERAHQRAAAR